MLRVFRIPFSTNVERVSLALAHKGLEAEWIDVDPGDRGAVRDASGQELVPVLVDDGQVVADSTAILYHLERRFPAPPLFPLDPHATATVEIFVDWFNRVWKRAPNEIEAERAKAEPDEERIAALGTELREALDLFEGLLDSSDYLFGEFSAADCAAFPFLKYAVDRNAEDDEPFHAILREFQPLDSGYPRLRAWIARMDARPRA